MVEPRPHLVHCTACDGIGLRLGHAGWVEVCLVCVGRGLAEVLPYVPGPETPGEELELYRITP